MMVVAMNVVGGLKREGIIEIRMDSIEENQNQKSKKGESSKTERMKERFCPKLELKIKEKIQVWE